MSSPTLQPEPLGIAVVDDHDIIHTGIAGRCAQADPPIKVLSAHLTAESFLEMHPGPRPGLSAVVLDLELRSRQTDFEALAAIVDAGHTVIVYSHVENDEVILRCLDVGAVTYLAKSEGQHHLIDAIRAAESVEPYVGPRMAGAIWSDATTGRPGLSQRELEVLSAWFQTESKEVVASRLHLSPATVKTHLQRIRAKYAAVGRPAPTKAKLVARAVQDGLVSVEEL
jgi:DNA-binding NarL/FixJ family response regulator